MEEKVKEIVQRYGGDKSYLVPILQDVQKEFNYLPKDALFAVGAHLSVPISRVYEVVTFYKAFSLKPKGRHQLSLCMGTAQTPSASRKVKRRPTSSFPTRRSAVSGPALWVPFSW
jgi:NADH-quinone oxidoreductase subunit E